MQLADYSVQHALVFIFTPKGLRLQPEAIDVCVFTVKAKYLMGTRDLRPQTSEQHKKESTLLKD